MLLRRRPSDRQVRQFLARQRALPFSYQAVGASRGPLPAGATVDHTRVRLGSGPAVWERAVAAVRRWEMFHLAWVQLCWPAAPIAVGSTVGVLAAHLGFWSLNAARVVYVLEEDGPVQRYGFAYGTLPGHVERGEERFSVEWHPADEAVWYDILAFSWPNHLLARLGYPVARMLQRRYARDSQRAMARAVAPPIR